jgi:anti-sigma-K factor RskA
MVVLSDARPPSDRDFEHWILRDAPVSAGVVRAAADGSATIELTIDDPGSVRGFALSLEPAGGARGDPPPVVVTAGTLPVPETG